jgi:hypothetical protein
MWSHPILEGWTTMELSKVPSAVTALACAACIAATTAVPRTEMAADHVAKTVAGDVRLSALTDLAWLSGIQAFLNFPAQGLHAFVPDATTTPPQAGYAALSGLYSYQQLLSQGPTALGGIAAFSAVPNWQSFLTTGDTSATGLGGIAAFSAVPNWQSFLTTGDTSATGLGGIAAFSAVPHWQSFLTTGDTSVTGLGGIAAFSAVPHWQNFVTSGDLTATGLGGIAAFSALGAVLDPPAPAAAPKTAAPQVTGIQTALTKNVVTPAPQIKTPKVANPLKALADVVSDPATPPATPDTPSLPTANTKTSAPSGKSSDGSYSGAFKPSNPLLLFGSGRGSRSADNGIRGWGNMLNGIHNALSGSKSSG